MRGLMLLLVAGVAVLGSAVSTGHCEPMPDGMHSLEFRIAESEPADGLKEAAIQGKDEKIYLHATAVLTNEHVSRVKPVIDAIGSPAISIRFNNEGRQKIEKVSEENLHKRLAILINGKVIAAPIIQSKISDEAHVTGKFTDDEVKKMVEQIGMKRTK